MNAKTQANATVFEQVYTSASALLDRTHGDLGVVCETVGFPREIQTDLDRLNSYQPLESMSGESPDKHPPAYTLSSRGPEGSLYSISRTVFAGADHTGRTNPLAHHFVVLTEAVRGNSTPADLLHSLRSLFLFRWDSVPRRLEHPRDVIVVKRLEAEHSFPSATWLQLTNAKRVAQILGFFAERMTSSVASAVVFVIPSNLGEEVCDLLVDLLAVLPAKTAYAISARTHVLSPPGIAGQCRVMFTYPKTDFLNQVWRRQDDDRPVIIDLVKGPSSELQFHDYGRQIEQALNADVSARHIESLVDLRSQMGVMQESSGTPFSDFVTLLQQLRSPKLISDVDAILPLLKNVGRASKAAETVAAGLLAKGIVGHFNARKGDSDWHALATLAFSNGVPDKPQQLAVQAIEKCGTQALPVVFGHPLLGGGPARRIRKWLQEWLERKGAVSSMIQHALRYPTDQNLECVRKIFLDYKPKATPDDLYDWGGILQVSKGPAIQEIRKLIGDFTTLKVDSGQISALDLMQAIPRIVDNCEESDRHQILFRLIEASSTDQLGEFVRFIAKTFGAEDEFITGYDVSKHSEIVRDAINNTLVPRSDKKESLGQKPLRPHGGPTNSSPSENPETRSEINDLLDSIVTLRGECWNLLIISTVLILVAFPVFTVDFKTKWLPQRPNSEPTATQWPGLLAFPLSVLFFGIMYWLVRSNTDLTRMRRSEWFLMAAIVAMFAGTVSTLYFGFHWLHR